MSNKVISKVGGIILNDGKTLIVRKKSTNVYITPGGKIDADESHEACLARELQEELSVLLVSSRYMDTFCAQAAFDEGVELKMHVYFANIEGTPTASSEIEEVKWVSYSEAQELPLASILGLQILPTLKKSGSISD